jgi:hypothetical protein
MERGTSVVHAPAWQRWGLVARGFVSVWLAYHVLAMFVSPWAVPPTSSLAVAIQGNVAHYQTLLYLNHGYRFFAPDPGPASIVGFTITKADGSQFTGIFPDRYAINRDYPRLNYHRWFMWSETLGRMFGQWVSPAEFARYIELEQVRVAELRQQGLAVEADRLVADLEEDRRVWEESEVARKRILAPLARVLLQRHQGQEIRLTLNRRMIPSLSEARAGMQPSDARLLEPERAFELGRWKWDETSQNVVFEDATATTPAAPTIEEIPANSESNRNE